MNTTSTIKAVIGLGNPGSSYKDTRHNIGFKVLDMLCERHHGNWQKQDHMEVAFVQIHGQRIMLVKPQTYMNNSGQIAPYLKQKGITAEHMLVVHDELELPFGSVKLRTGGSARGHNGLKSLIVHCGDTFTRVRFGISRPEVKEEVPDYVLSRFRESEHELEQALDKAVHLIEQTILQ